MTDMQIDALFLSENAKMDLCQAIYADTRIKHKWPTAIVVTAILVLYAGNFLGVGGYCLEDITIDTGSSCRLF